MTLFEPEPEQIEAFARWLMREDVKKAIAVYMPKVGGLPAARENRVADVAVSLQIHAAVKAELEKGTPCGDDNEPDDTENWRKGSLRDGMRAFARGKP